MIFSYERRGQADAPEIIYFQDVFDSSKTIKDFGKPFEPFFKILTIHLPQPIEWTKMNVIQEFSSQFSNEILPLLEESRFSKIAIWNGSTFPFWRILLKDNVNRFKMGVVFNPEMEKISLLPFFQDLLRSFRREQIFTLWDWIRLQPIFLHLQMLYSNKSLSLPFPILHLRSEDTIHPVTKEAENWSGISLHSEWYSFPSENFQSIKNSRAVKKLLLSRFAEESKIKKDRIWNILLQL